MSDELEVLKLVAQRLDGMAIPYMVSGSMAMNYYAEPRMTRDIDVVVALEPSDAARVVAAFGDDFYLDEDALRGAIAQRGTFNLIHDQRVVKVDFIVRKDTEFRRTEFSRRRPVRIDDSTVWIVSPEDLLLSKLVGGKTAARTCSGATRETWSNALRRSIASTSNTGRTSSGSPSCFARSAHERYAGSRSPPLPRKTDAPVR